MNVPTVLEALKTIPDRANGKGGNIRSMGFWRFCCLQRCMASVRCAGCDCGQSAAGEQAQGGRGSVAGD